MASHDKSNISSKTDTFENYSTFIKINMHFEKGGTNFPQFSLLT
jgi:hypothetical protein